MWRPQGKPIPRKLNANIMLRMYHVRFTIWQTPLNKARVILFSYTCKHFDDHDKFFMWNVSASEHCCQHCDGVIYKADSVIETIQHEDDCKTSESSVCKVLPGISFIGNLILQKKTFVFRPSICCNWSWISLQTLLWWQLRLFIFQEIFFKKFLGLNKLNSTKLEPSTCSQRTCYFADSLPHSSWISSKVK